MRSQASRLRPVPDDADVEILHVDHGTSFDPLGTVQSPGPRWPVVVIVVLLGVAIAGRLIADGSSGPPDRPATTTTDASEESAAPLARDAPPSGPVSERAFEPLPGVDVGRVVVATDDGALRMWAVDLAAGRATELAMPALPGAPIDDLRFFGGGRAVAALDDGGYALLDVGDTAVELDRVVDFSSRVSLGVDALTADAATAWVQIPAGFVRWDLADNTIDHRWVDAFESQATPPRPLGVVDRGLVVTASDRTFLISANGVEPLDLGGEVVATAGPWAVVRSCDDSLRCGRITAHDLTAGTVVAMSPDERFSDDCGTAVAGPNGELHLVLHRPVTTTLVTVTADGRMSSDDVPRIGVACVEVTGIDPGVMVAHEHGVVLMRGDEPLRVDLELGPVVALGTA